MLFKERLCILHWPSHFSWGFLAALHPALTLCVSWHVFTFTYDLACDLFHVSCKARIGLTCCCIPLPRKKGLGKEGEEISFKKRTHPIKNGYDRCVGILCLPPFWVCSALCWVTHATAHLVWNRNASWMEMRSCCLPGTSPCLVVLRKNGELCVIRL